MTTTKKSVPSPNELVDSLTGYDEEAIADHFGAPIEALFDEHPTRALRALAFIHEGRNGKSAGEAKKSAMGMTIKQVSEFFPDGEDEVFPEEPVTEEGKGD